MQFLTRFRGRATGLVLAGAFLVLPGGQAGADCACLCMDGNYRTVCTEAGEVSDNRGLCQARASQGCPSEPQALDQQTYEPPTEGTSNCRNAQIYDGETGDYVAAKVCDVAPASTPSG